MNVNQTLLRLVKDVNEIKAALRQVTTNLPLYDIANENTPAAISTDQNNYVPGNYDILRINATADITITGFAGGVKGRFLEILNVGTGRITYVDGSTSSLPANRFNLPYDNNVTQLPDARVRFYYDSTQERWTLSDAPNIEGFYGKSAMIGNSAIAVTNVSFSSDTKLTPDTVFYDEWGFWDGANYQFVIPPSEGGFYLASISGSWQHHSTISGTLRQIRIMRNNLENIGSLGVPNIAGVATNMVVSGLMRLSPGDVVHFEGRQDSDISLNFNRHTSLSPVAFLVKL